MVGVLLLFLHETFHERLLVPDTNLEQISTIGQMADVQRPIFHDGTGQHHPPEHIPYLNFVRPFGKCFEVEWLTNGVRIEYKLIAHIPHGEHDDGRILTGYDQCSGKLTTRVTVNSSKLNQCSSNTVKKTVLTFNP